MLELHVTRFTLHAGSTPNRFYVKRVTCKSLPRECSECIGYV